MKASGEKRDRPEQIKNITETGKICAKIGKKCSEKIRVESQKMSVEQNRASSGV